MDIITSNDEKRIATAVTLAGKNSSGEIRVHIQKKIKEDIYKTAIEKFDELGIAKTKLRNGVLVYIALENREFAIIGDVGINDNVENDFWDETVEQMKVYFRQDDLIGGIEKGLEVAGNALKQHFPHNDVKELSNEVSIED